MGTSKRTEVTTTNQKTEPWAGAQPYYADLYASAEAARKSGAPAPYPNSTVIDWSKPTQDAYTNMEAIARQGSALNGNAQNVANGVMTGSAFSGTPTGTYERLQRGIAPGFGTAAAAGTINNDAGNALMWNGLTGTNAGMPLLQQAYQNASYNPALDAFAGQTNYTNGSLDDARKLSQTAGYNPAAAMFGGQTGYTNSALTGQTDLAKYLAGNSNPAAKLLQDTASGIYLNSNPYIDKAIGNANQSFVDQFNNSIAPGIDSTMAAAGRLGSNAYANARNNAEKTTANAMATNAGNMMFNNYNSERTNQLNAQNTIGALYNSDVANRQNSLNALSSTSNAQQGQRLAAITGLGSTADSATKNQITAVQSAANIDNAQQSQRLAAITGMGNTADSIARNMIAASKNVADTDAQQQQTNNSALVNAGNLSHATSGLYLNAVNQDFTNRLNSANVQLNAANGQTSAQNAQTAQRLQAAGMAPGLRANDYADAQALLNVGQAYQARDGAFLQDDINKWNAEQNAVWTGLINQANILNGGGFNTTSGTQTKPIYTNNTAQITGALGSVAGLMAK